MRWDTLLVFGAIRDLVSDIRCARRDGMPEYEQECRAELARWFRNRHRMTVDRHGWPTPRRTP